MPTYKHDGPVDCTASLDASNVRGKLAIVTGGEIPSFRTVLTRFQILIVIQAPMGLVRHMSGLSNPPGEFFALFEAEERTC